MSVVPGRILNPPAIRYGKGNPAVDERASWNLRDVRFSAGGRLDDWGVLLIHDNSRDEFQGTSDPALLSTITGFSSMCRKSGMTVGQKTPTIVSVRLPPKNFQDPTRKAAIAEIRTALMTIKPKPSLAMVVLANGDKHIYNGIKHLCDSYLGLPTVCVQSAKVRKEKGQLQ
jgi:hypothetical protein